MALKTEQIVKLLQLKGIVSKTALMICEMTGNEALNNDDDLAQFLLGSKAYDKIQGFPRYTETEVNYAVEKGDKIIEESEKSNIKIISLSDEDYPASFKLMPDKPVILSIKGNLKLLNDKTGIAIVGTREPTKEGIEVGEYLGEYFGNKGYNVVSGLAKGCDTAAHRGSLKSNGMTTGIVAHGLHMIYPKVNEKLAEEILQNDGVLMSEYFVGQGADPGHFIERDRLQAGLSSATIVVQTDTEGSTMFTVKATLKYSKPLAAVVYNKSINSNEMLGNDMLIQEGNAFPLTSKNIEEFIKLIPVKVQKPDTLTTLRRYSCL